MTMPHTPPLVLVADDEVNTTIMLQHIFEREGYRVERANDGMNALEKARTLQPDLILLDILMPRMSGFDVLAVLREDPLTMRIPIILITANAREPADVERGLKLGADDYQYKPFSPQELLARAQSKIRARQLEDALQRRGQELETLLQLSDALNKHLSVSDLVTLIAHSVGEVIPTEYVIMQELTGQTHLGAFAFVHQPQDQTENAASTAPAFDPGSIVQHAAAHDGQMNWQRADQSPIPGMASGIVHLLYQNDQVVGFLLIARRQAAYDDDHHRLFTGISRQAALALHNAQLYELQLNYTQILESRVLERTQALESAQKLLLRSEKLASIGNLAASIAHEINNPLLPIRNLIDDLVDDLDERGIEIDQRAVEIIQDSLERIRGIVSRLLEFARDPGPGLMPVDISLVLENVLKLNRKHLEHSRIRIETDLPPLPALLASKDQLEQVFMNLMLNAQAAMEGGGTLYVAAYQQEDEIVTVFRDSGVGIPAENLERIFDPFFSTKISGTGLGLFVCHGIIQGHNGRMEVASKVNVGTTFTIYLPLTPSS